MFRDYLRRTGFSRQLTIAVSAAILGLALFSSLMNSWQASRRMEGYLVEQGQRIAENLARQSILALLYRSPDNAREAVSATLAFPDVEQVEITDAAHRMLLSQAQPGTEALPGMQHPADVALPLPALEWEDRRHWRFGAPVYGGHTEASPFDVQERRPQLLGYVHVVIGKGTLDHLIASLLIVNLAITLSFAAVLLGVMRLLARRMLEPLHALSALMGRAEAGQSGMRVAASGPSDIIEMTHAFNKMMDVLELREAELKQSRDDAMRVAMMKTQFAAMISHEVRTPLNGVVGMLDMLKEMHLTGRQRECVDVAWTSARALIELSNHILDFSKIEADKLELEEIEFDLRALVEDVIELLAGQARQKRLEIGYAMAPDVPQCIRGDSLRLRQVLINLLANAVKFTEHGKVAVNVSTLPGDGFGLLFEVTDTGAGIAPDAFKHVFESYAQADRSTTRKYGGTGLGLAICKQLVALMKGEIGVDSEYGKGSTFWFTVRCRPGGVAAADGDEQREPIAALPLTDGKYRVLVAEDNRTNQMVAAGMLTMNGCDCEFATNGHEAVDAVRRSRFDLILMDCSMPEMDGYEAAARIRRFEEALGRRTPIVAMTANAQQGDAEKCLAAGMDDYLAKPVTLAELRGKLERWLVRARPAA